MAKYLNAADKPMAIKARLCAVSSKSSEVAYNYSSITGSFAQFKRVNGTAVLHPKACMQECEVTSWAATLYVKSSPMAFDTSERMSAITWPPDIGMRSVLCSQSTNVLRAVPCHPVGVRRDVIVAPMSRLVFVGNTGLE